MMKYLLAATAALFAVPTAAEVVETGPSSFVTRDSATIAVRPLDVWLALTKPGEWWNDEHSWSGDASNMTLTPQAGGCFCERIPGNETPGTSPMDGSAQHAVVLQASPLKVLRLRGGLGPLQGEPATGILTITLKEVPGGTRILWEYNVGGPMRYEIPEISQAVDAVMSEQLHGLQDFLGALDEAFESEISDEPANDTPD